jgi:hypothetical protein
VLARFLEGLQDGVVGDEVAELGVVLVADRFLQRDRQLRDARISRTSPTASAAPRRSPRLRLAAQLCTSWRSTWATRFSFSTMCTGMRIVRALSAIARVTAWRIHQVA